MNYFRKEISAEEFKAFHDNFVEQNPWFPEVRLDGKFRVFIYLENNNFCLDIEENKVRMYACGITVYDLSHIGHALLYVYSLRFSH